MIFHKGSELKHGSPICAELLIDLTMAITYLYRLDVGAITANPLNTPTYVKNVVDDLMPDVTETAHRLEMVRSLLFGEELDWDQIEREISGIGGDAK